MVDSAVHGVCVCGGVDSHWPITVISALKMTDMSEGGWTERKKHRRHQFLASLAAKCKMHAETMMIHN